MPDIILPGPAGRIEVRYQRQKTPNAPMALVLHAHPQFGGTMNNPLVYDLYHMFLRLGCTSVRFNFRGVGRSQGTFDNGAGELSDAAAVLESLPHEGASGIDVHAPKTSALCRDHFHRPGAFN